MLTLSWPYIGSQSYLIFFAFIPLLLAELRISAFSRRRKGLKVFLHSYLTFLLFNYWTTWWIKLASPGGMVLAVVFNALFMSLVFLAFHFTKRSINHRVGYWSLIIYWLGFEYLHTNWELSWIWLNLGNVFSNDVTWIQWYEYTGTGGGTAWILMVNVLAFSILKFFVLDKLRGRRFIIWPLGFLILLFVPIAFSIHRYHSYVEEENAVEVVVLQPNIDPYNDKFSGMSEQEQIDKLMNLAYATATDETELIFGPETAFPMSYWESDLEKTYGLFKVREFQEKFPRPRFIVGLTSIRLYGKGDSPSVTARPIGDGSGRYYDYYNSVIQINPGSGFDIYRKSKLVLGVEKMPFAGNLKFLESLAIELGGSSGSLGVEGRPVVFESKTADNRNLSVIPAICYESIYGAYLAEFARKGANLIGVVTNDGWWGNTPGYWQHLSYSRLRAIELRRDVARSANTGISAFINQRGDITKQSEWWTADALRANVNLNDELTLFARYGDYPGRTAAFFSVLLFVWAWVKRLRGKVF